MSTHVIEPRCDVCADAANQEGAAHLCDECARDDTAAWASLEAENDSLRAQLAQEHSAGVAMSADLERLREEVEAARATEREAIKTMMENGKSLTAERDALQAELSRHRAALDSSQAVVYAWLLCEALNGPGEWKRAQVMYRDNMCDAMEKLLAQLRSRIQRGEGQSG